MALPERPPYPSYQLANQAIPFIALVDSAIHLVLDLVNGVVELHDLGDFIDQIDAVALIAASAFYRLHERGLLKTTHVRQEL